MRSQTMVRWLGLSIFIVFLDQLTKYFAQAHLVYAEPLVVMPNFNFTLLYNRGAAFSFLSDASGWQRWFFAVIASVAIVLLIAWLRKLKPEQRILGLSLSLILGGAAGNLIDRLWLGYVVDFIQLYYESFYWPAFNIADSAISVGAVLVLWDGIFGNQAGHEKNAG